LPCVRLPALADAGVVGKGRASLEMQLAMALAAEKKANMALELEKKGRAEDVRFALSAKTQQVHRETVRRFELLSILGNCLDSGA